MQHHFEKVGDEAAWQTWHLLNHLPEAKSLLLEMMLQRFHQCLEHQCFNDLEKLHLC